MLLWSGMVGKARVRNLVDCNDCTKHEQEVLNNLLVSHTRRLQSTDITTLIARKVLLFGGSWSHTESVLRKSRRVGRVDQNSDGNAPEPPLLPSCRPRSQLTIFTPDTVVFLIMQLRVT